MTVYSIGRFTGRTLGLLEQDITSAKYAGDVSSVSNGIPRGGPPMTGSLAHILSIYAICLPDWT